MRPAVAWLSPTAAIDCLSSAPNGLAPLAGVAAGIAVEENATSGDRTWADIWRIWLSRLLTSIVVMTVFQRVTGFRRGYCTMCAMEPNPLPSRGQAVLQPVLA